MKILILFSFLLFTKFLFSHSEIFNMTDGEFLPDQKFDKHYSFDLTFHKDVFVDELGVDFIDLGIDQTGNFKIKIFRNDSILNETSTLFGLNFNQIAYFNINYFFQEGLTYTFQIINLDIYTNNDNKITLFKPNKLPYTESADGIFTTSNLKSSSDTIQPFIESDFCPFVHVGTTTQNYINFSITNKTSFFDSQCALVKRSINLKSLNNISISGVGLLVHNSGQDSTSKFTIKIEDNNLSKTIFFKDSFIYKIDNESFLIKTDLVFEKNHSYNIEFDFADLHNNDDKLFLYKPMNTPYLENTKNIEILNFITSNEIDTLGIPIILKFNESLKINSLGQLKKFVIFSNQKIDLFDLPVEDKIEEINIYNMLGKKCYTYFNIPLNSTINLPFDTKVIGQYIIQIKHHNHSIRKYLIF